MTGLVQQGTFAFSSPLEIPRDLAITQADIIQIKRAEMLWGGGRIQPHALTSRTAHFSNSPYKPGPEQCCFLSRCQEICETLLLPHTEPRLQGHSAPVGWPLLLGLSLAIHPWPQHCPQSAPISPGPCCSMWLDVIARIPA